MNCARHPKVETNLRCGKCDQPICPKCAVQTPVGARCPDCARLTRLPVFRISLRDYSKALAIGLVVAAASGIAWGFLTPHLAGYGYLLALFVGYAIGEKKELHELSIDELQSFSDLIDPDIFDILTTHQMIERRQSFGGTSTQNVKDAIERAKKQVDEESAEIAIK